MHSNSDKRRIEDIKNKAGVDLQTAYKYYDLNNHDYEKTLAALKEKYNFTLTDDTELNEDNPKEDLSLNDYDKEIIKDISVRTGASLKIVLVHYNLNNHDYEKTIADLKEKYDFSDHDKECIERLQTKTGTNRRTAINYYVKNDHDYKKTLAEIRMQTGNQEFENKALIIEDMKEAVKQNYLSILVEFANLDNQISGEELLALYLLMTRIKTESETRQAVLRYISNNQSININNLLDAMDDETPDSSMKVLHLSLIKDILMASGGHFPELSSDQLKFISSICEKYDINKDQIIVLQKALDLDKQFLNGDIDDKQYAKMVSDLGAKAVAIGVPIAAIYLSGSVVGLSAAGITSGLATLGLGGVLGLSSMVTGVGAAVLIGVATYEGVKWLMGHGKKDQINKREYLMQEAISMNQKTISALIEDMNNLTKNLIHAISENDINAETISRLKKYITLFGNAFKKASQQDDKMKSDLNIGLSMEINHG